MITCLLVSYPLGSLYIRIPASHPELKHLFSIFISFFFLIPVLSLWGGSLQLLLNVVACYYIAKRHQTKSSTPWLIFL